MGCPDKCEIGDNLVFGICTHDPDTLELTDADAAPDYWIYEDENATEILSGNMAKFDGKTGHYTELIAVTSGAGFENGKTYSIFINATVDTAPGGIHYAFKAYDFVKSDLTAIGTSEAILALFKASAGTIVSGAAAAGTLSTTQMTTDLTEATNDHYNGRIIIWTSGDLQNQATNITDYDGGTGLLTFTATTEAPSDGDTFIII